MAPSVLGIGIPSTSPLVPEPARERLQKALDIMEADMTASPYAWEMFYVETDMDFSLLTQKLRAKDWDIVMVGLGLRTITQITPFFEKIVNAVHEELPKTKFAFNAEVHDVLTACKRVLPQ